MRNNDDIRSAIQRYMSAMGQTMTSMASRIGVSKSAVSRWISGESTEIKPSHWVRLQPLIQPFMAGGEKRELSPEEKELLDSLPCLSADEKLQINRILLRAVLRAERSGERG
jgi:transcriptional regulator with XRE-family HTH domain